MTASSAAPQIGRLALGAGAERAHRALLGAERRARAVVVGHDPLDGGVDRLRVEPARPLGLDLRGEGPDRDVVAPVLQLVEDGRDREEVAASG